MTTRRRHSTQRGSAMVEFSLVGLGLVFVLISIFEMARGMWVYHTLAHVSKEATRFLIVRGSECQDKSGCIASAQLGALATKLAQEGVGLDPNNFSIQVFRDGTQVVGSSGSYVTVQSLSGSTTVWDSIAKKGAFVSVNVRYPFRSAIAMFWPGNKGQVFGVFNLGASSQDTIQF